MADTESVTLSEQHAPQPRAIEAFKLLESKIKEEIIKSRKNWDGHEEQMYARVKDISNEDLVDFDVEKDLVAVRAGSVAYGTIIFGKIRLPKAGSDHFVHVRIHDPPDEDRSAKDVVYHSLFTDEKRKEGDTRPQGYNAIQHESDPLEFFSE